MAKASPVTTERVACPHCDTDSPLPGPVTLVPDPKVEGGFMLILECKGCFQRYQVLIGYVDENGVAPWEAVPYVETSDQS